MRPWAEQYSLKPAVSEYSSPAARKEGPELWNTEAEEAMMLRAITRQQPVRTQQTEKT
jgi:hypothetical protein